MLSKRHLIAVLAEMTNIGTKFGPVGRTKINELLPKDGVQWNHIQFLNDVEEEAKKRAGITEPRVVLNKLEWPPVHLRADKPSNKTKTKPKTTTTTKKASVGETSKPPKLVKATNPAKKRKLDEPVEGVRTRSRSNL